MTTEQIANEPITTDLHPITAAVHALMPMDFEDCTVIGFGEVERDPEYAESTRIYGNGFTLAGDYAAAALLTAATVLEEAGHTSMTPAMLRYLAADVEADAAGRDNQADEVTTDA